MKEEVTQEQLMEATQKIRDYYSDNNLDYYSIDWDNLPSWWPEELVTANKVIDDFYAQVPEGTRL